MQKTTYSQSLLITLVCYVFSFSIAYFITSLINISHIWINILCWHLLSTFFVFMFSSFYKNSSLYDPFWSVAPVPIVIYLCLLNNNDLLINLFLIFPIVFWSIRLTINWLISWPGLHHEDFRYVDLKNNIPIKSFINNFFGIHFIPTLIVNITLYPSYYLFMNIEELNFLFFIAFVFTISAVIIQLVADKQMRSFRTNPNNNGLTMKYGLWKYSRHPNYLGEILFWFGLFFMSITTSNDQYWTIIGPFLMLMLFIFISCPLMDERSLKKRSDFDDYMKKTSQLFFWIN